MNPTSQDGIAPKYFRAFIEAYGDLRIKAPRLDYLDFFSAWCGASA